MQRKGKDSKSKQRSNFFIVQFKPRFCLIQTIRKPTHIWMMDMALKKFILSIIILYIPKLPTAQISIFGLLQIMKLITRIQLLPWQLHRLFTILIIIIATTMIPSIYALSTVSISETSGSVTICALLGQDSSSSSLNCTSFPDGSRISDTPSSVPYTATVAGDGFVCGLRSSTSSSVSVLGCWRFSTSGTQYKRIYRGPPLRYLAAGNTHICGVLDDDDTARLQCWQWPDFNSNAAVVQNLTTVSIGDDFLCGLSANGTIICSGNHLIDQRKPPGSGHRLVEAGPNYACAVSMNGSLNCWGGGGAMAVIDKTPEGEFTSLALGQNRSCGIRANQTVACWGGNDFTLPADLVNEYFLGIESKQSVFCGVFTSNASLYCWGGSVNEIVFDNVAPGSCRSSCPCGAPLPLSARFCGRGYYICLELSCPLLEAPPPRSARNDKKATAFLIVGSIGTGCFLLLVAFLLFRYCKGKVCRIHDSGRLDSEVQPNSNSNPNPNPNPNPNQSKAAAPVLDKRLSHLVSMGQNVEEYSLQLLREATNGFSEEFKIGSGSFGSVYRAKLEDGQEIAIKRAELITSLNVVGTAAKRQLEDKDHAFVNELESLSRLHHKNLVKLLGFCEDGNELILVYEFMSNGTLHDHLHRFIVNHSPLMSWTARIKVALDAARGMEYLHVYASPPVIHRDIKSSNILLDSNWVAKVSDFGLSLEGPEEDDEDSHLSLHAAGTLGYVDPEYYRLQKLTLKSDVYSFGVVLLELLSGYRAIHKNENEMARNVVDVVVPYIIHDQIHRVLDGKVPPPNPFEIEAVKYVGYLAADCVSLEGRDRPSSTDIVDSLQRALNACSAQHGIGRSSSLTGNNYNTSSNVDISFLKAFQSSKSF